MSQEVKVSSHIVRHFGTFDTAKLSEDILVFCRGKGLDAMEKSHKIKAGDGGEQEISINATKKQTHYVQYDIDVEIKCRNLKDVEVVKEGKKIKMQHGRIEVKIDSKLILDWEDKWNKSDFTKFLHKIYKRFIFDFTMKHKWGARLIGMTRQLLEVINKNLGLV